MGRVAIFAPLPYARMCESADGDTTSSDQREASEMRGREESVWWLCHVWSTLALCVPLKQRFGGVKAGTAG